MEEQPPVIEQKTRDQKKADNLTKGQWKHHKKELKKYQGKVEKLEKENIKLRSIQKKHNSQKAELREQIAKCNVEHSEELKMLVEQNEILQNKIIQMEREVGKSTSQLTEKINRIGNLKKAVARLEEKKERYFYQILSRLDADDLISSLNAPDEVLELLSTVVRVPTTDCNDKPVEDSTTMIDFWNDLIVREQRLVQKILEITDKAIAKNQYFQEWAERKDEIIDLKCSLSVRIFISDMFLNILRQYFLHDE